MHDCSHDIAWNYSLHIKGAPAPRQTRSSLLDCKFCEHLPGNIAALMHGFRLMTLPGSVAALAYAYLAITQPLCMIAVMTHAWNYSLLLKGAPVPLVWGTLQMLAWQ